MTAPPNRDILLLTLQAGGITLSLAPDTGRLVVDAPKGALTDDLRAALQQRKDELRGALPMPADGWPCLGGCGRQSQFTPDRHLYRCWICTYREQKEAAL